MSNELWDQLCTIAALRRGWHLTRTDTNQDFITEPFARETFAYFLDENLSEILRILKLGDYQPTPLTRVSIPKGALGTRPGTLLVHRRIRPIHPSLPRPGGQAGLFLAAASDPGSPS
jgi:hypothetical protein